MGFGKTLLKKHLVIWTFALSTFISTYFGLASPAEASDAKTAFWVRLDSGELVEKWASLAATGDHSLVYIAEGATFTQSSRLVSEFDKVIYPGVRRLFGSEPYPGIDGDPRITILLVNMPNATRGYFDPINQYRMDKSNEREMLIINVHDMALNMVFSTLAHEFQHLIHYGVDPNEQMWVTEGLAQYAEMALYGNKDSLTSYVRNTSTSLTEWNGSPQSYGASLAFMSFLAGAYLDNGSFQSLVAETRDGVEGIDAYLRNFGVVFQEVFHKWTLANYLGNKSFDKQIVPVVMTDVDSTLFLPPWSATYVVPNPNSNDINIHIETPSSKITATAIYKDTSGTVHVYEVDGLKVDKGLWSGVLTTEPSRTIVVFETSSRSPASGLANSMTIDYGKAGVSFLALSGMVMTVARQS